jgi:hypothetical protein
MKSYHNMISYYDIRYDIIVCHDIISDIMLEFSGCGSRKGVEDEDPSSKRLFLVLQVFFFVCIAQGGTASVSHRFVWGVYHPVRVSPDNLGAAQAGVHPQSLRQGRYQVLGDQ